MFAEMLLHSEEKIFLEAIDQYFENETLEDAKNFSSQISFPTGLMPTDNINNNLDTIKETEIEKMNNKFYETLNIENKDKAKDISTDYESDENNNIINEKYYIKLSDYLILSKFSIKEIKDKIYQYYKNKINYGEINKNIVKKEKKEQIEKNMLKTINNNN